MYRKLSYLFLIALVISTGTMWGQQDTIQIIQTCEAEYRLKEGVKILDKGQGATYVNKLISDLIAEDYLESNLDSTSLRDSLMTYYLHVGPQYDFTQMELDSLSTALLNSIKIRPPGNTRDFLETREKLLAYYGQRGYPFAKVRLKDSSIENGIVKGIMHIEPARKITLDSLVVKGNLKLRESYLRHYLDLSQGEPYNHEKIKTVRRKLDRLSFVRITQEPELSFIYDYASLNLYLDAKNTSRFDLIFGVIPTNNVEGKQLFLSMDFTAELLNKFGYGEYVLVDFERLRPEQQKFDFRFNYPYLLDTPFAIDSKFSIFRNELDYQTLLTDMGLQYFLNSTDKIKIAYNLEQSRVIELDTVTIKQGELPDDLNVSQAGMSISAEMYRVDYRFNPRRGFSLESQLVFGLKRITEDGSISRFKESVPAFQEKFDALEKRSQRYEAKINGAFYVPLASRGAIGFQLKSGWRYSPAGLLRNELYQIGGNKLLRGFDEASIFTPYYLVSTLEYKLAIGRNSYFQFPFIDVGLVELEQKRDLHIGLGTGMIMETKVGLFNFSVAVGRSNRLPFDFSKPKAHFGYISLF